MSVKRRPCTACDETGYIKIFSGVHCVGTRRCPACGGTGESAEPSRRAESLKRAIDQKARKGGFR